MVRLDFVISILLAGTATIGSAQTPDPSKVYLNELNYSGSGCPANSAAALLSPDLQAFTVAFSEYFAEMGPAVAPQSRRRDCQVQVGVVFPEGWQFTIFRIDYRGFADLEEGAWGMQHATARFRGGMIHRPSHMRLEGPVSRDYVVSDELALTTRGWSPCRGQASRELTIDTRIQVGGRSGAQGLMTVDSIDGEVEQTYRLLWRRC